MLNGQEHNSSLYPADESLNPGDELSSLAEETQPPSCGEEMGLQQGGSTRRCQRTAEGPKHSSGPGSASTGSFLSASGPSSGKGGQ